MTRDEEDARQRRAEREYKALCILFGVSPLIFMGTIYACQWISDLISEMS